MASTRPVMWPPDRGFRREPPTNLDAENISAFEKIIRYAEKDDLLLYLTALFGVFMPAVMYFVYKTAHAKYEAYAKKKREEKRKEKARQRALTLFYMPVSAQFKKLAFELAEKLESFDPVVVSLIPGNLKMFRGYKGSPSFLYRGFLYT
uniref:RSN1_TM domain-containing protein n=1 Tax=Bursaphelenchus xylophilus TaxID=6326 RepID=A0A1I7SG73_BURXY